MRPVHRVVCFLQFSQNMFFWLLCNTLYEYAHAGGSPDAPERTLVMHLELIPAQEASGYAKIVVELVVF